MSTFNVRDINDARAAMKAIEDRIFSCYVQGLPNDPWGMLNVALECFNTVTEGMDTDRVETFEAIFEALEAIFEERARQIHSKGFDSERDDRYVNGELAEAAGAYVLQAAIQSVESFPGELGEPGLSWWPWPKSGWKPQDRERNLIRAGALIVAELERLKRAKCKAPEEGK